jgi:hypothetical protein
MLKKPVRAKARLEQFDGCRYRSVCLHELIFKLLNLQERIKFPLAPIDSGRVSYNASGSLRDALRAIIVDIWEGREASAQIGPFATRTLELNYLIAMF